MEQRTFYVDMEPITFKPDTILFENAFPIVQFKKLLITADIKNAIVLPKRINHVPPSISSNAV